MHHKTRLLLLVPLGLLVAACTSTTVVDQWRDGDYAGPAMRKILVIGMSKEAARRRQFEDVMVSQIRALQRADALASHELLPSESALEKEQIVEAISGREIDGVLITRLVREDQRARQVEHPGVGPTSRNYYGYYSNAYNRIRSPGYVFHDTVVTLQTNLYLASTEQLVWAGTTESFEPESATQIIDELAPMLVKTLAKEELI